MARKINSETLEKIKSWEGFVPYAYDDADPATPKNKVNQGDPVRGTLTIGYGSTGYRSRVRPGMEISEAKASEYLAEDLAKFESEVERLVKVPLTDNQFGALVSFHYNTGALATSTLLKKLNAGDYASVPYEMAKWVKTTINGKKVRSEGLVNRRAAEAGLWASGAYVASNAVPVAPMTKPIITLESVGVGAAAVGSMASVFDGRGPVQYALAGVIGVGFAAAAIMFLKKRLSTR